MSSQEPRTFSGKRKGRTSGMRVAHHEAWKDALMIHFPVSAKLLRQYVPEELEIEEFDGSAYVSLVLLSECAISGPSQVTLMGIQFSHHAVNCRTYVRFRGVRGVYFFSLHSTSNLMQSTRLMGAPYLKANNERRRSITEIENGEAVTKWEVIPIEEQPGGLYEDREYGHKKSRTSLEGGETEQFQYRYDCRNQQGFLWKMLQPTSTEWAVEWRYSDTTEFEAESNSFEEFVFERYCLYISWGIVMMRVPISHPPWRIRKAEINPQQTQSEAHFSDVDGFELLSKFVQERLLGHLQHNAKPTHDDTRVINVEIARKSHRAFVGNAIDIDLYFPECMVV